MEIIVGKLSGFCYGVNNAVTKAEEIIRNENDVYCIGEIVHNRQVVSKLENLGMKTVESIDEVPNGKSVIFRSHGMPECDYEFAKQKNLKIYDLTCPSVINLHEKVKKMRDKSFIILVGKIGHAENIGTIGFAGNNSFILENEDDIIDCYKKYEESNMKNVYVVFQTTFNMKKAEEISEEIKHEFYEADVVIDNTICNSTELRQKEVKELAKSVNKMVIVGGKNSSNTTKLAQISKEYCENVYHIETKDELKKEWFDLNDKIGIMAGASTPRESIEDVKKQISLLS